MSRSFSQTGLSLTVSTPLGTDVVKVEALRGEDGMSRPFRYEVDLVSGDTDLDFKKLIGKGITISIGFPDGAKRELHGLVTRFSQGTTDSSATRYRAELRPWIWMLTLSSDSKVFQNLKAPDIIEKIFSDMGFSDYRFDLKRSYTEREYCVQYGETSLDFVHRLLEEEGVFYYFQHEAGKHTLVLGDDPSTYAPCPVVDKIRYRGSRTTAEEVDALMGCELEERVVTGGFATDDFFFETPSSDLAVEVGGDGGKLFQHQYPGGFTTTAEGESVARRWLEAEEAGRRVLHGNGALRSFLPGHHFKLQDHDRKDVNDDYTVLDLFVAADQDRFQASFSAVPKSTFFRPSRITRRPAIAGSQTATVVGKQGEEIWTDKYGRVKVQFHWDREGTSNEDSSCWIRVAQGWAGKNWGAFFLPRIGQEVIVSFLSGNPDRPIITGSVYNAEQVVPYPLPDGQAKSAIKSNSSKGGAGFNEIRFDDTKGEEELYLHAQKDMKVEILNDRTTTVTKNLVMTVTEGDETHTLEKGARTVTVTDGQETHTVGGERTVSVTGDEKHSNEGAFTHEVLGDFTLKVTGKLLIDATGGVTVKSGADMQMEASTSLTNKAGTALTNKAGTALSNEAGTALTNKAGTSLSNTATTTLTNEASISLTSKGSAATNVESGGILALKGALVKLN